GDEVSQAMGQRAGLASARPRDDRSGPVVISAAARCSASNPARGSVESGRYGAGSSCNDRAVKAEQASRSASGVACSERGTFDKLEVFAILAGETLILLCGNSNSRL